MSKYTVMPAKAGPMSAASSGGSTARSNGGKKARPMVST